MGKGDESPLGWLLTDEVLPNQVAAPVEVEVEQVGPILNAEALSVETAFQLLRFVYAQKPTSEKNFDQPAHQAVCRIEEFAEAVEIDVKESPWLFQLVKVELLLACIYQQQAVGKVKKRAKRSLTELEIFVAENFDGDGMPDGGLLPIYGPLIASVARSIRIATELKVKLNAMASYQLEWAARQIIRLCRSDGTLMGTERGAAPLTRAAAKCILELSSDPLDHKVAESVLPFGRAKKVKGEFPECSGLSEWAGLAVFRRNWKNNSAKVACRFKDETLWLEVARDVTLIRGEFAPQISCNGELLRPEGELELVTEFMDEDVDFLELEIDYPRGIRLQRQILFGREDEFLMLSDVITSPAEARIDYRATVPCVQDVVGVSEKENTEIYLERGSIQSLVLPMALPEWKVARTDDQFGFADHHLTLSQSLVGKGLFAGLFFDLNPGRALLPRTWRRLTVAEEMRILNQDESAAFRVQIGEDQWVIYRSIGETGNRTFMGENRIVEFFVGRLEADGEMVELMEVE